MKQKNKKAKPKTVFLWGGALTFLMVDGVEAIQVARVTLDAESGLVLAKVGNPNKGFRPDNNDLKQIRLQLENMTKALGIKGSHVIVKPSIF